MSAFKAGDKVVHDFHAYNGSRVYTYKYRVDENSSVVASKFGKEHTLITRYLKLIPVLPELAVREERWLVWSPTGTTNPTVVHNSENEARKVARQMAERHGGTFYAVKVGPGYHQGPAVKPPIEEV